MMISQPALICLNATWQRLTGKSARGGEQDTPRIQYVPVPVDAVESDVVAAVEPSLISQAAGESLVSVAQGHEPAGGAVVDASTPLAANERRARAAALRAMALSRERRFDAARAAFAEAAGLDPALDLTRTPAFWKLERAAHEAAIHAYQQAGRDRDAAVLRARIQSTFRPKALRRRPQVVLSP